MTKSNPGVVRDVTLEPRHEWIMNDASMGAAVLVHSSKYPDLRLYTLGGCMNVVSENYGPSLVAVCSRGLNCNGEGHA